MRSFSDIPSFVSFLNVLAATERDHSVLMRRAEMAGKEIVKNAQDRLGTYQSGWAPLQPETIRRKITGDSPLLETGAMRDSISYEAEPAGLGKATVTVGSTHKEALAHEIGTSHVPPRPFLVPAAMEIAPKVGADMAIDLLARLTRAS